MYLAQTLRRSAQLQGDRLALVEGDYRLSWASFEDRVARLAGGLAARGVAPGDRVAMVSHNSARYVEFFYACFWAGAVAVPLNTRWAGPELAYALEDSGTKVVCADGDHAPRVAALRDACGLTHCLFADAGLAPEGWESFDTVAEAPRLADQGAGKDDLACLFYTGGTTGRSKGVMLSHNNILANSLTAMLNMDIRDDSVHLHVSPMFHVAGGARIFSTTLAGGRHVVIPRFEPGPFLKTLEAEGVTVTIIVPTMLARLVREPALSTTDLSALKLLTYGASPMPEALLREAMAKLPGVRFLQSYGMTELSPVATVLTPEYHVFEGPKAGKTASAGQPAYNADVVVLGPDDTPVPPGQIGEICVRGPMVMQGYWQQPELTAEALRGGYMHTGDAGYFDEDGFLFIVDRLKDMIVSGGENVYSAEVEDALYSHPAVQECAVIGIPSEQWGEAVHAVVVRKAGQSVSEADLVAHCKARIAGFKVPRSISFSEDELPKSGPGKILKTDLRAPFWAGRDRAVN